MLEGLGTRRERAAMGHGHGHGSASGQHGGRLWGALGLGGAFLAVETTIGGATGSLAPSSGAAHMPTDVVGIGLALAAVVAAAKAKTNQKQERTFGMYR